MKKPKYRYNIETCQYERSRITLRDVFINTIGILFTASIFFVAVVFLHNRFVTTEYEQSLRTENKVLKSHKVVLAKNLTEIEATLETLQQEERSLYTKLFNTSPPAVSYSTSSLPKEKVLLANASAFQSMLDILNDRSGKLFSKSANSNEKFSERVHITQADVHTLSSLPSIQPLLNAEPDKLVSGFGKRINPFHKGMYLHPGVDFVAPRGTEVIATAPGHIISINKSELQAGYGNSIVIDHGHGYSTRYAHLEEIKIKSGQKVTKGMVIGTVGNSGGSIAPHLHYEVMQNDEHVDPALYIIEGITPTQHHQLLERSKKQNQSLD